MNFVFKANGKRQPYASHKLAKSLRASCLAVGSSIDEADKYSELATAKVERWLKTKAEVTSQDLRLRAGRELARYHPDAAYFYQKYKELI